MIILAILLFLLVFTLTWLTIEGWIIIAKEEIEKRKARKEEK